MNFFLLLAILMVGLFDDKLFLSFTDHTPPLAEILTSQIGYGNAAGYLFNRSMLPAPPQGTSSGADAADAQVNPITGMVQKEQPPGPEMTDEEKEREAEKLFVLFERLEKAGGMENPLKKALHEGKLEKYNNTKDEDDSD